MYSVKSLPLRCSSNTSHSKGGSVYSGPGSDNAADQLYTQCPTVQEDIPYCQAKGKKIVLSLGGAARDYQLTGKDAGIEFADFLLGAYGPLTDAWKASNGIRPLDRGYSNTTSDTIDIDGFDFDIEHTSTDQQHGYVSCIHRLRALFATNSKKYLITGAPQCYLPEVNMGGMIAQAQFDILWIQFYNNPSCSVRNFAENNIDINYNTWKSQLAGGASSGAQLYIGIPGAPSEGTGCEKSSYGEYISAQDADRLIKKYQSDSSFGGVMLWEATVALNNECNCKPYYSVIKDSLKGTSPPPALSACPVTSTTISATSSTASSSLLSLSTSSSVPITSTILSSSSSIEIPTSLSTSASSTSSSAIFTSSASSSEIATPSITTVSSASSTSLTLTPTLSQTSSSVSTLPSFSRSSSSATKSSKFPTFTPPYGNVTCKPTFTSSRASNPSTVIRDDFTLTTSSGASHPTTVIIDEFPLTTSTVYTTKTGTVTKRPATVTNCPLGSVTTETMYVFFLFVCISELSLQWLRISSFPLSGSSNPTRNFMLILFSALYTTICPVSQANNGGVPTSIPAISAQSENQAGCTTSTVYTSKIYTITACAPGVNCAGTPGSVVTEVIPLYTTVCPITQDSNGGIPTSVPGLPSSPSSPSSPGVPAEYTTSTIYTTKFSTVTACAPGVLCQQTPGSVLTEVIPLSTTVIPLPQSSFTTYVTIQVASAVFTPIDTPLAPYPTPSKGQNKSPYGSGTGTAYSYPLKPTGTSVPSIQVVEINSVAPSFSKTGGGIKAVAPTGTPISPSDTPSLISSNSASGFGSSLVLVMVSAVLVSALMM
ncbi:hypothetical protein HYALB_00005926 [Hymenoscyphus albidus]|uniref:chitinase n=1 Tax=Hymenoscyphus albidus TaxID=595503 RepID=A0A9N9LSH1_9HELO|nr:hypothetical protein HYALB_00005926 [Hymenoscyphus albidus]